MQIHKIDDEHDKTELGIEISIIKGRIQTLPLNSYRATPLP